MPSGRQTILVLGGARSGKSRHAENLVNAVPEPAYYVATAQAFDDEMAARIASHRQRRNEEWQTIEAPVQLAAALNRIPPDRPVLIDCLTLWLSNLVLGDYPLEENIAGLEEELVRRRGLTAIVSNEVGLSIVPENALSRRFRDEQGLLNQRIADIADRVVFVAAGLPLILKG